MSLRLSRVIFAEFFCRCVPCGRKRLVLIGLAALGAALLLNRISR